MLKDNNSNVWKYFNKKIKYQSNKTKKNIKHYVIPTTSGSGSESTQYAVIFNADVEIKKAISNQYLICDKIFYENSLLATMNRAITINSSFDALGQAIESLLSKKRNSLSDKYAIQTLKLIFEFLPKVLNDITNPNYRKKLFVSSILSGKAISITETNFCHAICDTLGPYTNKNHGKLVGYFTSITLNFFKKNFKSYNKPINKINFIAKEYNFISINSFIHKYNQCEMINIKNVLLRYKMSKTIYKVGSMKNCLCYISKYQIMRLLSEC